MIVSDDDEKAYAREVDGDFPTPRLSKGEHPIFMKVVFSSERKRP